MSANFRELICENQNNINVKLTLEAPVGTSIIETEVRARATVTLHPNVNDIRAVKIKVVAGGDEHTDIETFELRGSPFPDVLRNVAGSDQYWLHSRPGNG